MAKELEQRIIEGLGIDPAVTVVRSLKLISSVTGATTVVLEIVVDEELDDVEVHEFDVIERRTVPE